MGKSFYQQQSFARSLTSIHLTQEQTDLQRRPSWTSNGINGEDNGHISSSEKQDHRVKVGRGNRRGSLNTITDSPESKALAFTSTLLTTNTPPYTSRVAVIVPPVQSIQFPSLPFSDDEISTLEPDDSYRERQPKKFRRRDLNEKRRDSRKVVRFSQKQQHTGFRKDYKLGDTIRCPSHMIAEPTPTRAFDAANKLQKHDFAFIKRSNGSYSYAILADRSKDHDATNGTDSENIDECMVFVMNDAASVKRITKRHWGDLIRLVSR